MALPAKVLPLPHFTDKETESQRFWQRAQGLQLAAMLLTYTQYCLSTLYLESCPVPKMATNWKRENVAEFGL